MSINDRLRDLLGANQSDRLSKEKSQQDRTADPSLPRHTIYKGDRTIQQLGNQPIENGVILNNQSLAIGDVMLPLAKGNVLRRVDSTNGGALLGTAYRDAVEKDFDANGKRRSTVLSRNGGDEPSDPSNPNSPTNPNRPKKNPDRVPPPFGCTPPPSKCFWSSNPIAPNGFQNHGDAVVNENALPVYLHCMAGTSAPSNLNCGFLDPKNWSCLGGICSPNPNGIYTSQAQCEAALIAPTFTGGQSSVVYNVYITGQFPFPNSANGVEQFAGQRTGPLNIYEYSQAPNASSIRVDWFSGVTPQNSLYYEANTPGTRLLSARVVRSDGQPDTGGNRPSTCPI